MSLRSYTPSGRFSPMIIAWGAGLTVAMCLVAWVYQFLLDWVPYIYGSILIMIVFAVALAGLAKLVIGQAKCRNPTVAAVVACSAALIAMGAGHYFGYIHGTNELAARAEVQAESPGLTGSDIRGDIGLWEYTTIRADEGWTIGRSVGSSDSGHILGLPMSGIFVWLVWLFEAGIMVGAVFFAAHKSTNTPYCENCDTWADRSVFELAIRNIGLVDVEMVTHATTLDHLLNISGNIQNPISNRLIYKMTCCPECNGATHLTVKHETTSKNEDGEDKTKAVDLRRNIVLNPQDLPRIDEFAQGLKPAVS